MRSRGRLHLLISNTVFAVVGAAVMFAVVRFTGEELPRSDESEEPSESVSEVDRSNTSQSEAWPPLERLSAGPGSLLELEPESESAPSWSTEARTEQQTPLPAPRFSLRFPWQSPVPARPQRTYTLKARLAEIAPPALSRLAVRFETAKAAWPPAEIAMLAIKDEKALELHARAVGEPWKLIHRYKVLAASGRVGPKLRQGDRQVPEGIYAISFLNPNSAYHVSLRVNYPNAFDRQMAAKEGRKDLGGDIMIHGKNLSAGCLAMGDEAVEEIFVLAAQAGLANVKLIIAPTDFRQNKAPPADPGGPEWVPALYTEVASAMTPFKVAEKPTGLLSFFMK